VRNLPTLDRGTALGIYTAFVDLSLGISGPLAGVIVLAVGYPPIFLFAATMAAFSMALAIALYRRRAEPSNLTAVTSHLKPDRDSSTADNKRWQVLSAHDAKSERRDPPIHAPRF
jgi:MFS family permease